MPGFLSVCSWLALQLFVIMSFEIGMQVCLFQPCMTIRACWGGPEGCGTDGVMQQLPGEGWELGKRGVGMQGAAFKDWQGEGGAWVAYGWETVGV